MAGCTILRKQGSCNRRPIRKDIALPCIGRGSTQQQALPPTDDQDLEYAQQSPLSSAERNAQACLIRHAHDLSSDIMCMFSVRMYKCVCMCV